MFFLVDSSKKIIFGWSAKSGSSFIINLFWFFQTNNIFNEIHTVKDNMDLPIDIENYTTIIFIRNPYKRIISGFLDKYKESGQYRHLWKHLTISFVQFVEELLKNDWKMIDPHHFLPQTSEYFNKKILLSKSIKFYDIENIDYNYIENLYNKKILDKVLNIKRGHERSSCIKKDKILEKNVYNLNLDEYIDYNVDIKYFYNEEIKNKVFNFYKNDFIFFNENGIDYINTVL